MKARVLHVLGKPTAAFALAIAFAQGASAAGNVRPHTNAHAPGADKQSNVGSSVNNPALSPAPSAQRAPAHAPPDPKLGGAVEADAREVMRARDPLPDEADISGRSAVNVPDAAVEADVSEQGSEPGQREGRRRSLPRAGGQGERTVR